MNLSKIILQKLQHIKLVSLDVDGVLTDGKLVWGNAGLERLSFNVKDGSAIQEIIQRRYSIVIISATKSEIIQNRMKSLGLKRVYTDVRDKICILKKTVSELGIEPSNVLHVADDRNDLPALKFSGLSFCPNDAISEVKECSDLVLNTKGGDGVCVELLEILSAVNKSKV